METMVTNIVGRCHELKNAHSILCAVLEGSDEQHILLFGLEANIQYFKIFLTENWRYWIWMFKERK